MIEGWSIKLKEWLMTSSNVALSESLHSRCPVYFRSSALSSHTAFMSCAAEFGPMLPSAAAPRTTDSAAVGKTTAAETGSLVTPAVAATPTPTTPGARASSSVSTVLVVGTTLAGGFLIL
ncbi:hypothetical protein M0657_003861 [Pyricularia oryzae]|nr:hypothetical protein M9X92_004518 [Pyricularia oryzae]KAI7926102.1 hypothetical protein M0657_003861 [Pyricularia oryzae]